jgi:ATP-dependent DNA helicase RecQ
MLRREVVRSRKTAAKRQGGAELPGQAQPLFERLRSWRAATAREQGVPAYIVFGDATLRGIAVVEPTSREQLAEISGVGEKKLDAYGAAILAIVAGREPDSAAPPSPVSSFTPAPDRGTRSAAREDPTDDIPLDDEPPFDEWGPE